jgi:hypothetical protein
MALKGGQKKLDANKNNKVDSGDFAILRKKGSSKAQGRKQAMPRKKGM